MSLQGHQIGRFANEAGQALSVPIGSPDEATVLRGFLLVNIWFSLRSGPFCLVEKYLS